MKLTQIRNATIILEVQGRQLLVDPMLARQGRLPRLRYVKSNRRNPLVELPEQFWERAPQINGALITHCQKGHFDHLDRAGVGWLKKCSIEVYCTPHDHAYLSKKGLKTQMLPQKVSPFLTGTIEQVPAKHTRGWLTPFMEHGTGYFICLKNEPSVYLMGDTILTDEIRNFIREKQPDVIVAPTGKAQFDMGAPLLLDESEIIELAQISSATIVANHMEALDHCRITRSDLATLIGEHELSHRFIIPADGETIELKVKEQMKHKSLLSKT